MRRSEAGTSTFRRRRRTTGYSMADSDEAARRRIPITAIDDMRSHAQQAVASGGSSEAGADHTAALTVPRPRLIATAAERPDVSSVGAAPLLGSPSPLGTEDCVRWSCHLHKSSSSCEIALCRLTGDMYHIVSVKETTSYAQRTFNARTENDEFWERLSRKHWYSPLAYCNMGNDYRVFESAMRILRALDERSLVYHQYNGPHDFVKRHLIVDGDTSLALCNKHLIKKVKRKQPQVKYTGDAWVKGFLKALFPGATGSRRIPTSTPSWAIEMLTRKGGGSLTDGLLFDSLATPQSSATRTMSGGTSATGSKPSSAASTHSPFVVVSPYSEVNVQADPAIGLRFVKQ